MSVIAGSFCFELIIPLGLELNQKIHVSIGLDSKLWRGVGCCHWSLPLMLLSEMFHDLCSKCCLGERVSGKPLGNVANQASKRLCNARLETIAPSILPSRGHTADGTKKLYLDRSKSCTSWIRFLLTILTHHANADEFTVDEVGKFSIQENQHEFCHLNGSVPSCVRL